MENKWLNLMNLIKKLISTEIVYHLKYKKYILNELVEERLFKFRNLGKKIILINCFISIKLKE